jgi:hypothetical protein
MKRCVLPYFKTLSIPPYYDGYWAPITPSDKYLGTLYRIRSGRPYRVTGFPPDTIPLYCEGSNVDSHWAMPAVYERVTDRRWEARSSGCRYSPYREGDLDAGDMFTFTYERGGRLSIRYARVSYPLRYTLCSWVEVEMERAWGM